MNLSFGHKTQLRIIINFCKILHVCLGMFNMGTLPMVPILRIFSSGPHHAKISWSLIDKIFQGRDTINHVSKNYCVDMIGFFYVFYIFFIIACSRSSSIATFNIKYDNILEIPSKSFHLKCQVQTFLEDYDLWDCTYIRLYNIPIT